MLQPALSQLSNQNLVLQQPFHSPVGISAAAVFIPQSSDLSRDRYPAGFAGKKNKLENSPGMRGLLVALWDAELGSQIQHPWTFCLPWGFLARLGFALGSIIPCWENSTAKSLCGSAGQDSVTASIPELVKQPVWLGKLLLAHSHVGMARSS